MPLDSGYKNPAMIIDSQPALEELTTGSPSEEARWQAELRLMYHDAASLLRDLAIPLDQFPGGELAARQFPLRVTRHFASLMKPGDPHDPLLRQVIPQAIEQSVPPGFSFDPLQEVQSPPAPGLLHKYPGRVLLVTSGACAIHCRYCFRRHYPYQEQSPDRRHWQSLFDYLDQDPEVTEVILSGGDPLMLSDHQLQHLIRGLAERPQIGILRVHSRLPTVLPERLNSTLLGVFTQFPGRVVLVTHANHPREINNKSIRALERLAPVATLLNQSVLLKGINDEVETLAQLSRQLFTARVLPYYLHQLDPVVGAAHFLVSDKAARQLHQALINQLPGYLVPRLVREIPGQAAKTPL